MRIKGIIAAIIAAVVLFFCQNNSEFADMAVIRAIALCQKGETTVFTALVMTVEEQEQYAVETGEGETIGEAIRQFELSVGKRCYYKECFVITYNADSPQEFVVQTAVWLLSSESAREGMSVTIAQNGEELLRQIAQDPEKTLERLQTGETTLFEMINYDRMRLSENKTYPFIQSPDAKTYFTAVFDLTKNRFILKQALNKD